MPDPSAETTQLPSREKSAVRRGADAGAARRSAAPATAGSTDARGQRGQTAALPQPAKTRAKASVEAGTATRDDLNGRRRTASEAPARGYHHGNLREALLAAAVQIIDSQGLEQLSVREAAKRAGVSPGAPFRHFASRAALLAAVAEQATQRLHEAMQQRLQAAAQQPALARFAAMGHAYLDWARRNPTHFRLISDRHAFDHASAPDIGARNQAIRDTMGELLREALGDRAAEAQVAQLQLMARALVYGLARMDADGHFPEWRLGVPAPGPADPASTRAARTAGAATQNTPSAQKSPKKRAAGEPPPGTQALDAFVQLLAPPDQAMR